MTATVKESFTVGYSPFLTEKHLSGYSGDEASKPLYADSRSVIAAIFAPGIRVASRLMAGGPWLYNTLRGKAGCLSYTGFEPPATRGTSKLSVSGSLTAMYEGLK
jgi:hypothetical protein